MSLLSSRVGFTHACTIERDANAGTTNARGTQNAPNWQTHLADEPCKFWVDAGREVVLERGGTIEPLTDLRVLVRADADVTEADRVASVTYRGGTAQEGPLGVRAVLRRPDHIELVLVKV